MKDCKRHPGGSQPGGSVCSNCLQERLSQLWRGESFHLEAAEEIPVTSSAPDELSNFSASLEPVVYPIPFQEAIAIVGSIASIRKQLQENGVVARCTGSRESASSKVNVNMSGILPDVSNDVLNRNNGDVGDLQKTSTDILRKGNRVSGEALPDPSCPQQHYYDLNDIMKEWSELHAKRRSNVTTAVLDEKAETLIDDGKSKQLILPKPCLDVPMASMNIMSRSSPLVNKIAEEIALRVIGEETDEEADDLFPKDLEGFGDVNCLQDHDGGGDTFHETLKEQDPVTCFSPVWQGKMSSKWVKVLVNPMISSNKVFPSRSKEDARKGQARMSTKIDNLRKESVLVGEYPMEQRACQQEASGCTPPRRRIISQSEMDISKGIVEGMPERILQQEDMAHRLNTSRDAVLSWLQNLPSPQTPLFQKTGKLEEFPSPSSFTMSSEITDKRVEDLAVLGHLHEIAEEHEILEESSVEDEISADLPSEMSSFGKFLILAAQRHPKLSSSRNVSATSR